MVKVIIMVDINQADWVDGGSYEFSSAADAKIFIEMIQEHGIGGDHDLNDVYVFYDYKQKAFVIQASE